MEHLLIAGLGNPGPRYAGNRHNIGFILLDEFANKNNFFWKASKKYEEASNQDIEIRIHLLKPLEYMNLSGNAVSQIAKTYKIPPDKILILQDEVDLPFGKIKNKIGGGTAGHNGLKDIVAKLGSNEFHRLRFGVGKPEKGQMEVADFVLQNFSEDEKKILPTLISESIKKMEEWINNMSTSKNRVGEK